jgi:hypothetical protein
VGTRPEPVVAPVIPMILTLMIRATDDALVWAGQPLVEVLPYESESNHSGAGLGGCAAGQVGRSPRAAMSRLPGRQAGGIVLACTPGRRSANAVATYRSQTGGRRDGSPRAAALSDSPDRGEPRVDGDRLGGSSRRPEDPQLYPQWTRSNMARTMIQTGRDTEALVSTPRHGPFRNSRAPPEHHSPRLWEIRA